MRPSYHINLITLLLSVRDRLREVGIEDAAIALRGREDYEKLVHALDASSEGMMVRDQRISDGMKIAGFKVIYHTSGQG